MITGDRLADMTVFLNETQVKRLALVIKISKFQNWNWSQLP
jgi:hypothetical protein